MEHRLDTRIQAPMNVVVHTNDGTFLRGLTRNISHGGAVIETDKLSAIDKKKVVRVEFIEDEIAAKVPSYVMRCSEEAAVVMFITLPPALQSYLDYLMSNAFVG